MLIEQLSTAFAKALNSGNSVATQFASLDILNTDPATLYSDGVVTCTLDESLITQPRLLLLPYGEGGVSSQFSVRVYGWRRLASAAHTTPTAVWIPYLLCELACTTCIRGGPPNPAGIGVSTLAILDSELACDTITLTQGALGLKGFINSTGPGTNLIATAIVETWGAQRISFDFQAADTGNNNSMNCLWAKV